MHSKRRGCTRVRIPDVPPESVQPNKRNLSYDLHRNERMASSLDYVAGDRNRKGAIMTTDPRRVTLVARHPGLPERDWDLSSKAPSRVIFIDAFSVLRYAVDHGIELARDVERVIIDRTGSAMQYLEFIESLSQEFLGDVMFVRADGTAYLSSVGRGGGRVLYSLTQIDVEFYLNTHGLTELEMHAAICLPAMERQTA